MSAGLLAGIGTLGLWQLLRPLPELPPQLELQIIEKLNHHAQLYTAATGYDFPPPKVFFDWRDPAQYASANAKKWRIRFNPWKCIEQPEHVLNETVPHELAHLIHRRRYGYAWKSHGEKFQEIYLQLGGNPDHGYIEEWRL